MSGTSLYIHVPFCTKKCGYCHFYVERNKPHSDYLASLEREWSLYKDRYGPFLTLYFGGGTPSLLLPEEIERLIKQFPLVPDAEITLEVNPETATRDNLFRFRQAGINRLSIGVQSFDDQLLKKLTRTHDKERAITVVHDAQAAGFTNISIDLMYDLPGQTLSSWKETLRIAADLQISHLSLYNLTIEPETAFFRKPPKQPPENESLQLLNEATQYLPSRGLERYEISAFARNTCASVHNVGYWTGRPFLGLGPSAFSYLEGMRFKNSGPKWQELLRSGQSPVDFSERLDPAARERETTALGLRLLKGIPDRPLPQHLFDMGLLERFGERIRLSEKGLLLYDAIASEII